MQANQFTCPLKNRYNGIDSGNTVNLYLFVETVYPHLAHTQTHLNTDTAGLEKGGSEVALCQVWCCQETPYTLVSSGILITCTHKQTHTLPSAVLHGSCGKLVTVIRS